MLRDICSIVWAIKTGLILGWLLSSSANGEEGDFVKAKPPAKAACQCGCGEKECKCSGDCASKKMSTIIQTLSLLEEKIDKQAVVVQAVQGYVPSVPILFDEEDINRLTYHLSPREYTGLAPTWCTACPAKERQFSTSKLVKVNWINENHPDWRDISKNCQQFPAVRCDFTNQFYYNGSLATDTHFLRAVYDQQKLQRIQPFTAGLIDLPIKNLNLPSILPTLRTILGDTGDYRLGNAEQVLKTEWVSLRFPALSKGSWTTKSGETKLAFNPKPSIRVKVVEQTVSSITFSDTSISIQIDWFPDVTIR